MAVILSIDTSDTACSVALSAEGMILTHRENTEGRNHAALLSGFVKDMLDFAADKGVRLEAVAVSMGPGSYTGLRIGLSEAKGLAYGLGVPLIGLSTLKVMATAVMFGPVCPDPEAILVPMLDARRMEVYTAAYGMALDELVPPRALVLTEPGNPYVELLDTGRPVVFFGNGMPKWREWLGGTAPANAVFVDGVMPLAVDMLALAEQAYVRRDFLDVAYSTPCYLKDFQATKPRNRVLGR